MLAGCFSPRAQPGSPCANGSVCPEGLACSPATMTCERAAADAPIAIDVPPITLDACVAEICGDGIDQDCNGIDPPCPMNDQPSDAIDVTAGGPFNADLEFAGVDSAANGCGSDGGRDVFYKVSKSQAEIYYFDTFGSSFDTTIRVYPGMTCPALIANGSMACSNDACTTPQSQLAIRLPSGTSCIVVAQASASETTGTLVLHVTATGRDGTALPPAVAGTSTVNGNTCTSPSTANSSCQTASLTRGDEYYFTTCPATVRVDLDMCGPTWDSVTYVKNAGGTQLKCNDDSMMCSITDGPSYMRDGVVDGPALFWAGVSGWDTSDCGTYGMLVKFH
jgi:hypothetical protein